MPALIAWMTTLLIPTAALAQTREVSTPSPAGPMPWSFFAVIGLVAFVAVLAWVLSRRGHGRRRSIRF